MSSVRGVNRRASGVPFGRTRPRVFSISCSRPSSARGGKLAQQRLRDLAGETLDEVHATLRPDLDDPARNLAVIDGTREVVGHGRAREVHRELDVDREPHANGLLGGGDAVMTVKAHVLQAQPIGSHSFTTGFLREPTPSTRISTRSPGRSRAAPAGVPVAMTSPGMS